jgi:hypothetical protein
LKHSRKRKFPPLVPLRYGEPYCELCKETITPPGPVAWYRVRGGDGRLRRTAYCATCHHENVRAGKALR